MLRECLYFVEPHLIKYEKILIELLIQIVDTSIGNFARKVVSLQKPSSVCITSPFLTLMVEECLSSSQHRPRGSC